MTSIIQSLKESVTPKVLESIQTQAGTDADKTNLIESLYALLASQLTSKSTVERIVAAQASDSQKLEYKDVFLSKLLGDNTEPAVLTAIYEKMGEKFTLPTATVAATAASALPLAFAHIKTAAADKPIDEYLSDHKEGLLSIVPSWLLGLLPAGLVGAIVAAPTNPISTAVHAAESAVHSAESAVSDAAAAATNAAANAANTATTAATNLAHNLSDKAKEEGGFLKSLLPIIGLIILGGLAWLMLKSCQKAPTPVAAPVAKDTATQSAAALEPASLHFTLNDKGDTATECHSHVGNDGLGEQVRTAIKGVFGKTDDCHIETVPNTANDMPAAQYLPQILGFMKGVPNGDIEIFDKKILLNSSDPAALEKMAADIKGSLPADGGFVVETAAAAPSAALAPATFGLALDEKGENLYACDSKVGSEGLGETIRSAIAGIFGKADACKVEVADGIDTSLPLAEQLPQIVGFVKGVPNGTLNFDGKKLLVNSSDPEALKKLIDNIKGVLPEGYTVESEPALNAAEAVANAINASKAAIEGLTAESSADDLVKALNLQIINFASGKNTIPAENQAILDKAATLMTQIPNIKLKIIGHTDNVGKAEANQKLSESRAAAVRDYLVSKGVDTKLLSVEGVRDTKPIASNATEQGRFKNRRIEFTLLQDGEVIANTEGNDGTASATAPADAPADDKKDDKKE